MIRRLVLNIGSKDDIEVTTRMSRVSNCWVGHTSTRYALAYSDDSLIGIILKYPNMAE